MDTAGKSWLNTGYISKLEILKRTLEPSFWLFLRRYSFWDGFTLERPFPWGLRIILASAYLEQFHHFLCYVTLTCAVIMLTSHNSYFKSFYFDCACVLSPHQCSCTATEMQFDLVVLCATNCISRGGTTWTGDFKCREVKLDFAERDERKPDFRWLEIWSNHFCPSMGPNGGSVAMDSGGWCSSGMHS